MPTDPTRSASLTRSDVGTPGSLGVPGLTWSVLLARWVEFAQASVAWSAEGEGAAWRASVPDVIQIQALWFALGETEKLDPAEQALARDRTAVSLAEHHARLVRAWGSDGAIPVAIRELVAETSHRLTDLEGRLA